MSRTSSFRTAFYAAMLTACAIVCAVQCVSQFSLYWSEPAAMTVTIAKGERVLFPAFTVCPSLKFSRARTAAWGLLKRRGTGVDWRLFPANESVATFWRQAGVQLDELVDACNRGACEPAGLAGGAAAAGHWAPLVARNGMCYTFTANRTLVVKNEEKLDIVFNVQVGDHFARMDKFYVDVYFHGSEPAIVHSNFFNVADHPKVKVLPGDIINVDMTGRRAEFKSLKRRRCWKRVGYSEAKCLQRCMWLAQARSVGCRAPWMDGLAPTDAPPLCNTSAQFTAMQYSASLRRGSVDCRHCQPACVVDTYQVQVSSSQNIARFGSSGRCKLLARWPYQMEISTEEITYTLSGLISDVGGNMSLLLGVSVISIVQATEMVLIMLKRRARLLQASVKAAPPMAVVKKMTPQLPCHTFPPAVMIVATEGPIWSAYAGPADSATRK